MEAPAHVLMILGSMDEFVRLTEMAKERGYRTIVCDGYPEGPAKSVADVALNINVRDTDAVAKACKEYGVDGIISSFSDVLGECLVNIADAAGLPCYAKPERFKYLREKKLMKEMFAKLGVPTAKAMLVSEETLDEAVKEIGFPCVIKPESGWGSRGVFVVNSEEELPCLFAETASCSSTGKCIMETYSEGYEINMMTWIVDGTPVILSMADREKSVEVPNAIPHVSRIVYPSVFTEDAYNQAWEIASKIANYVGIECGPLCIQFFYEPGKGITVCEAAGRIFGYEHELLDMAGGPLIENLLLDNVYNQDAVRITLASHSCKLPGRACGLYFHAYEGYVGDVSTLSTLGQTADMVQDFLVYYQPGDFVSHKAGAKPYAARYYLSATSRDELNEATASLYAAAKMTDQAGNNMLYKNETLCYDELS